MSHTITSSTDVNNENRNKTHTYKLEMAGYYYHYYYFLCVQGTNLGVDMNGTHQVFAFADDVNLIGNDIRTRE
jgi:hypothetical protein